VLVRVKSAMWRRRARQQESVAERCGEVEGAFGLWLRHWLAFERVFCAHHHQCSAAEKFLSHSLHL
jgi:hypothetical protein